MGQFCLDNYRTLYRNYRRGLDKATLLNVFFVSVFVTDDGSDLTLLLSNCCELSTIDFDIVDVFEFLMKQPRKFSRGPDTLPHVIFHWLSAAFALPLFLLYKRSLDRGVVEGV